MYLFQVLQQGGTESPTKPKGRPRKHSLNEDVDDSKSFVSKEADDINKKQNFDNRSNKEGVNNKNDEILCHENDTEMNCGNEVVSPPHIGKVTSTSQKINIHFQGLEHIEDRLHKNRDDNRHVENNHREVYHNKLSEDWKVIK